ncbi:hypothetical protein MUA04_02775 [Enterobacteriaceae bacterium H11S18]|uniref:hypothetical protein n=1 Tax=Dryocola clanedunensis TaxID=2925396 RepID=UPI0022EFE467|nr:hypothetical protein [Dryocola clanedunensis]MCT4709125.1 hypothetical protein [Dryocola clanedunensis]
MSYTHIIVKMKADGKNKSVSHIETDLDENFVVEHIIKPYIAGEIVIVDGARAESQSIEKITVFRSEEDARQLVVEAQNQVRQGSARERANRIFGGRMAGSDVQSVLRSEGVEQVTRKMFNLALGI